MRQVYLHVGFHRTGTTFLQEKVFPKLEEQGFIFNPPELISLTEKFFFGESTADDVGKLKNLLSAMQEPCLLSSEGLSMRPWTQEYPQLPDSISSVFHGAKILMVVRDPCDWLHSLHGLAVKKGRFVSFEEFVGLKTGLPHGENNQFGSGLRKADINLQKLQLAETVASFKEKFGKQAVTVLPFEILQEAPEDFIVRVENFFQKSALGSINFTKVNSSPREILTAAAILNYTIWRWLNLIFPINSMPVRIGWRVSRCIKRLKWPYRSSSCGCERIDSKVRWIIQDEISHLNKVCGTDY